MKIDLSDEIIAKIAHLLKFEKMKLDDTANMSWAPHLVQNGQSLFMRKGVVGDWKNFFSVEQSEELDKKSGDKLKGLIIKFDFGK